MNERADIFGDSDFDVSGFGPAKPAPAPPPEAIKKIAEAAKFTSREPAPAKSKKKPRTYRTGRNMQLNVRVRDYTLNDVYSISDTQGWVLGETIERAIAALKRELDTR
jgi:hypothetical protein